MERRDFIAMVASTPTTALANAAFDAQEPPAPKPLSVTLLGTGIWVTVLCHAVPSAQAPVNFSGRWTLDVPATATTPAVPGTPAAAAAPGDMGSGWGATITVVQDEKRLSVEYEVFSRYDLQPPLTFIYPLDGSEGRNTVMVGRGDQIDASRAQWDGAKLILVTTVHVDDRAAPKPFIFELRRTLWLESPTTMVVEVTRSGALGGPSSTTRSIYRKG